MRLTIRFLQIRVRTESASFGADIKFEVGLNILRAENSSGKSTVLQSMIYALGLEGMLSASHDVPLPHVMTDSIEFGEERLPVMESTVALEIENGAGRVATVMRYAKGARNKNLISVSEGASLTSAESRPEWVDYYVREGGAAVNQRGFHRWFVDFVEWKLPMVTRIDGSECPLYAECIFPLMIVEQKRGWSGIQARMPFHYRIRDVSKKSVEFLLALDVYELAIQRQRLREQAVAIRSEWVRVTAQISTLASSINAIAKNLSEEPPLAWADDHAPLLLSPSGNKWIAISEVIAGDSAELQKLEENEIPKVEAIADAAQAALESNEKELADADFAASDLLREVESEEQQLENVDERLAALEDDERRNQDIIKLRKMGSVASLDTAHGRCPTCHREAADVLLPPSSGRVPMTVEESLKYIRSQLETFAVIREAAVKALSAKRHQLAALRSRSNELRRQIRALRQTLVADSGQPSVEAIEKRLTLRAKMSNAKQVLDLVEIEIRKMKDISIRWRSNQEALNALPKGDLTAHDIHKLQHLRDAFVSALKQYGFKSIDPNSLRVSDDSYRPEHDGFNLEFDISASDMIRAIWAYLNALMEISRSTETNHLGLLILDEPKQQETAKVSFRELFVRASSAALHKQQVIIATSEDEVSLKPLLEAVPHRYISYPERIIGILRQDATDVDAEEFDERSSWESEAYSAVQSALESLDYDEQTRRVHLSGPDGISLVANNREELEEHLREIAAAAWAANVPFDGGEAAFECDEAGIVADLIGPFEDEIDEFFAQGQDANDDESLL